jgi:hypothetical protein
LADYLTPVIGGDCAADGSVTLAAGDNKVCTITNTKKANITIIKEVTGAGDLQDFAFTKSGDFSGTFSLDDDFGVFGADSVLSDTSTVFSVPPGSNYMVVETQPNAFWTLIAINCPGATVTLDLPNNKVTITVAAGENVTCTFVNTKFEDNTRTQGFFKNHVSFTTAIFENTKFDYPGIGIVDSTFTVGSGGHTITIETPEELFGAWLASSPKLSSNAKRTTAGDPPRITELHQLITAKMNCATFGCSAATQALIASCDIAFDTLTGITACTSSLDTYNNSGETAILFTDPAVGNGKVKPGTTGVSFWDILTTHS